MKASSFLRTTLLAATVAVLAAARPSVAETVRVDGPGARSARAHLNVEVRVPPVARAVSGGHAGQLAITADDVERGFVDVAGATIDVVANLRGPKRLVASVVAAFAQAVEIAGLPQEVVARPDAELPLGDGARGVVNRRFDVRYRIHLARGTLPGVYPWPVFLRIGVV